MSHQVPDDSRLEIKFVTSVTEVATLLRWLRVHPAVFSVAYPDRRINNIYFDSHQYFAYAENLFGASARAKVRYRWYGCNDYPDDGALEIKCKRNNFSWKLRYPVPVNPYEPGNSWLDIRRNLSAHLPPDARIQLDAHPLPVILNLYDRRYFVSRDETVRATIDTGQVVYDQRYKPYPNVLHKTTMPDMLVMEFKFDRDDREVAKQILQGLPIRVSRHSKYVAGIQAIHGY